jgi:archaellin
MGGEDSPPVPSAVGAAQPGVMIRTTGDITGQGVILAGVPRGTIDTITFTVGLAPGINTMDMSTISIVYADVVRTEILTPVDGFRGNPPQGYWGIVGTANELGNPNLRMEFDEQFSIRINPRAPVVPNQIVTISVRPREGLPLIFRRVAPSSIVVDDNVLMAL